MHPKSDQDGLVLIVALWVLIILSLIAAGLIALSQSERRIARNTTDLAEDRALAEAAINRAIAAMITKDFAFTLAFDGTSVIVEIDGKSVDVAVEDEAGKVDLNFSSETTLSDLFFGLGIERSRADSIAAAIADWRDEDNVRRLNGAEKDDYIRAGLNYGPRNGLFESVDEARRVLGFDSELFEKAEPFLTVFSRRSGINLQNASPSLLRALSSARVSGASDAHQPERSDNPTDIVGRAFTIRARVASRSQWTRQMTVRFTANPKSPVLIQDWR